MADFNCKETRRAMATPPSQDYREGRSWKVHFIICVGGDIRRPAAGQSNSPSPCGNSLRQAPEDRFLAEVHLLPGLFFGIVETLQMEQAMHEIEAKLL